MDDSTQQCLIVCTSFTILLVLCLFFGGSCAEGSRKAINECVKQGQDVEACRRAMP